MKALIIAGHGGPEKLVVREWPDPVAGPGQALVRVRAAGVNFADLMARAGTYPDAPPPPCVVGYEVAGLVESLGEGVDGLKVGDRVLAGTYFNGYAELAVARADAVIPLPEQLSFEQGAAVPVNYATAYAAAITMGGLREGERLLVHSAGGGVGIAALQLARSVGAEIFGTASAGKHEAIRAEGCQYPIDYRKGDFAREVLRLTGGEGVDVVLDPVGPSSFRRSYRVLRPGGRLVMFGISELQPGPKRSLPAVLKGLARMPWATMPWWKSLVMLNENKGVLGLNLLHWWRQEGLGRVIAPLVGLLEGGVLRPRVADVFPFERAGEAHGLLMRRGNVGKVVLTP